MKQVYEDKIINIDSNLFDNKFLFEYFDKINIDGDIDIIYIEKILKKRENKEIKEKVKNKPAMYSNVYSPKDELEIFKKLFNDAIKNNKKTHIIGITLKEEVEILEKYYEELGFLREDINCFLPDFSTPLVTVSVKIENLMWKGSDYKANREKIFFIPPVRESGQNKAMFKGINRGVIAGIHIDKFDENIEKFLNKCIFQEKILPITMSKVLNYNLEKVGYIGDKRELVVEY